MALASTMVFEIRQTGADSNAGGFNSARGGTDYTLQDSPLINVSDGASTSGSAVITSATANFPADCVGNMISISGANAHFEIISRASATSITVDRTTGLITTSGLTLIVGGAWATPGRLTTLGTSTFAVSGQKAWVKYNATSYVCSTSTAGAAGPCQLVASVIFTVEGYDVTRGDRTGNRPTYKWTTNPGSLTYAFKALGSVRQAFLNLAVDGNTVQTLVGGFDVSASRVSAAECAVSNCVPSGTVGYVAGGTGPVVKCYGFNCIAPFTGGGTYVKCFADCNSIGSSTAYSTPTAAVKCVARNAGTGFTAGSGTLWSNCTADVCGTGFGNSNQSTVDSCLATNCTTVGFQASTSHTYHNCAAWNNVANMSGTPLLNEGTWASGSSITSLTGNPYTSAGTDFRPNATSGAGLALWAAALDVYGQTAQQDVGALQHADPAGSAGILVYRGFGGLHG